MYLAHYFLQGEVAHGGLPQWLVENIGLSGNEPEPVAMVIWVDSNGGDVLAAMEAVNLIRSSSIPVITIVNGCAESAALLIAMAGHHRMIFKGSWGMAHHYSTSMEGSYHDLTDSVKHNELLHQSMLKMFKTFTKMEESVILEKFLSRGTLWISEDEMMTYGMADEIVEPSKDFRAKLLRHARTIKV